MNKNSIIFSITITFVIALLLVFVSFSVLYNFSEKREDHFMEKRTKEATNIFLRQYAKQGVSNELKERLELINFELICDVDKQKEILENPKLRYKKSHYKRKNHARIQQLKVAKVCYVYIQTQNEDFLLANKNQRQNHRGIILSIFSSVVFIFIFLYISTIRKLKPLNTLKDKVQNFGNEEFDISCANNKKDEISLLANEFDKSAQKLKKLKDSRNVFIRNIMHELKTPITKGKFLTELSQTQENNIKMQKVFYRLEALINEFASIEELISTKKEIEFKEYHLEDMVDNACDLLMCDEENIVKDFEAVVLNADFKLFSIAVKNLIDNGIKYSNNKVVTLRSDERSIVFESVGKKLKYDLESYFEPFFKGDEVKSNQSFGLGLYIVKHVLDAHNFGFEYLYKDGKNKFIIRF